MCQLHSVSIVAADPSHSSTRVSTLQWDIVKPYAGIIGIGKSTAAAAEGTMREWLQW